MATMGVDRVMVDTNVLVHSVVSASPFQQRAREALQRLRDDECELWVSRQVLREYLSVLSRPQTYSQPLPWAALVADVRSYEQQFQVAEEDGAITAKLLDLGGQVAVGGKQVHDANLVATMLVLGIDRLLTFNVGDFQRFAGHVQVEEPA
ncbi:MAG: type II toxin-antitoxin system VapC family toxin [Armatimonadetes bacterium]|nr:type II toxin-antitoxin system VapC family toxin [Armatimonadota bacterium]